MPGRPPGRPPDASVPSAPVTDGGPARLVELAVAMSAVADQAGRSPLEEPVHAAAHQVPGARWASVTVLRGGSFTTEAASHEEALRADVRQYEPGSGPCVDAVPDDNVSVTGDIRLDVRWGEYGRLASQDATARSRDIARDVAETGARPSGAASPARPCASRTALLHRF